MTVDFRLFFECERGANKVSLCAFVSVGGGNDTETLKSGEEVKSTNLDFPNFMDVSPWLVCETDAVASGSVVFEEIVAVFFGGAGGMPIFPMNQFNC